MVPAEKSAQNSPASESTGTLFVVSAPSGAGKTSLVRKLLEVEANMVLSVSHTTRSARRGEQDGVDYHFVDAAGYESMLAAGEFLEHATVFGNRYGTSSKAVDAQLTSGKDVVLEIDWQGAKQVRERMAESISIFILPPSRAILETRLRNRGTDAPEVIENRLRAAGGEIAHFAEFDYLLINDDFDQTLAALRQIVGASRHRTPAQRKRHADLIGDLLADSGSIE